MKTIKKNELYESLGGFLKSKGIELKNGVYSHRINRACDLLTDAINETNRTMKRAKVKVDEKLDQLRQSIHQATAPSAGSRQARAAKRKAKGRRARSSSKMK
jgi:hypothetical protein